ncbi:MAG: FKBP-type peptidyl-prolyl cis-trans isomerase [Propionibacteriaceae bacterium]|nr:FKBP-type peptidyl-prolyl cis-trans isomerase [Propionibacteriaceae bacterium]
MNKLHVFVLLSALTALTACTGSGTPATPTASGSATATPTPSATIPVSSSLDAITVTGKALKDPKIKFTAPFAIDKTRVKVLSEGDGPEVQADGYVSVWYKGVDGRTGAEFDSSYEYTVTTTPTADTASPSATPTPEVQTYEGQAVSFSLDGVITGFKTGLTGQKVGSRVLIAMPGSDAYDASGGNSSDGINVGDTLIFVCDIVGASLAGPQGKAVTPKAGLPTVTDKGEEAPEVTIPKTDPPSAMEAQVLIEGTGAEVALDDNILTHYVTYSWKTGEQIESKYDAVDAGVLNTAIPGWQTGLKGKKIGSRVLLVLPPEDGFPNGSNDPPLEAGDTIVYVVDLLGKAD